MITIYTFVGKREDLIKHQQYSFETNLKQDFEHIVINNEALANNSLSQKIKDECNKLNIKYIDVCIDKDLMERCCKLDNKPHIHDGKNYYNAGIAHAYALCWAWKHHIKHKKDKVLILDMDMFFLKPELLNMDNYDLMYCPQTRPNVSEYIWPGFLLMNMNTLPNLDDFDLFCGLIDGTGVDVGGQTAIYLQNNKNNLKIKHILIPNIVDDKLKNLFDPPYYQYVNLNFDNYNGILHMAGASNWAYHSKNYIKNKTDWVLKQLYK